MSDAPKQIWCGPDADGTWDYVWAELEPDPDLGRTVEYVLASELEALRKENERLRGMLKAEVRGALWVCPDCDIARCKHYRAALQGETG